MKRILVISTFPAPYRVGVFNGLKKVYELDVFFERMTDDNRNAEFFSKKSENGYYLLSDESDRVVFEDCIKNIKRYDLVLGYDWYLKDALRLELKCLLYNIPYIVNCDGAFVKKSTNWKSFYRNCLKHLFISKAALCFSSGKSATEYYLHYGAKETRIVEHPFSSLYKKDILQKCIPIEEKARLKKELQLDPSRKMVLSVGQFIPRKGYTHLLNVWDEFDESYQLVLVGGGKEETLYKNIIREKNLNHVTLVGFKVKEELMRYYYAADLFVLPTLEDIWGLVINEAMSFGLPVISTNRCNAAIELIDESNGYVTEFDSEKDLAKGLEYCLKADCNKMGEQSLERIRNYTIEGVITSHLNSLKNVLGE